MKKTGFERIIVILLTVFLLIYNVGTDYVQASTANQVLKGKNG